MSRNILAIFLGALILNAGTELHQLLKIPVLFQHFLHHRSENTSLSLLAFLKIHYTDRQHPYDNDDEEDNKLPFKSSAVSHIDIPIPGKKIITEFISPVPEKTLMAHPEGILRHQSFPVFHPPRCT